MEKRETNIIEAAIRVFTRYGVKRTTMNDIASEAGVVRQTLYNVYANKDEVLKATIRWYSEVALAAIEAECEKADTLEEKLDIVFSNLVVKPYELLDATPHAEDIIEGFNESAREEISNASQEHVTAIEKLLSPHKKKIQAAGLDTLEFADLIQKSTKGIKQYADNKRHLMALLTSLKLMVLKVAD